jgi:hypothetical protein
MLAAKRQAIYSVFARLPAGIVRGLASAPLDLGLEGEDEEEEGEEGEGGEGDEEYGAISPGGDGGVGGGQTGRC